MKKILENMLVATIYFLFFIMVISILGAVYYQLTSY